MTPYVYVVPIIESELGWGSKIDGYQGPFDSFEKAQSWMESYNEKWNSDDTVPDWYMYADEPVPYNENNHKNYLKTYKV